MWYVAPPLRPFRLPLLSRCLDEVFFLMSAISLEEVRAARGGLDGGDGIPETASGIPLCPPGAGSGVVESSQAGVRVDAIGTGEDIGLAVNILAITITTMT